MKKILFSSVLGLFSFMSCTTNHIKISSWKKEALDTSQECPNITFLKNRKEVCTLILSRFTEKNLKGFQILFEIDTLDNLLDFPKNRITYEYWSDSTKSFAIPVDTCKSTLCRSKFSIPIEQVEHFVDDMSDGLDQRLCPTKAFLWAMKKNNYY